MIRNYRFERQVRQNKTNRDAVRNMVNDIFYCGDEKTIYLYLDRDKNEFWASTRKNRAKALLPIGIIKKSKSEKGYNKELLKIDSGKVISYMRDLPLICKTTILNEYKKYVAKADLDECMEMAYVVSVDNPYYKCAGEMMLYCKETFEWLINKKLKNQNR